MRRSNPGSSHGVIDSLDWVHELRNSPREFRKDLRKLVMDSLKSYSAKGEGNPDTRAGVALAKELVENYVFQGFAPNILYVKEKGQDRGEEEAIYVHPWGTPTLVFKHKYLPCVVMVNPGIRLDESFLQEMPFNKEYAEMLGFSG